MELSAPLTLAEYFREAETGLHLFCDPDAPQQLAQAIGPQDQAMTILIGPEGGWSPEEQKVALDAQAQAIRFGHRVLRTETAALAPLGGPAPTALLASLAPGTSLGVNPDPTKPGQLVVALNGGVQLPAWLVSLNTASSGKLAGRWRREKYQ